LLLAALYTKICLAMPALQALADGYRDEEFHMLTKIFQISGALILLMLTSATLVIVERVTTAQEATRVPNFEMDPLFFQNLPNRWTTGQVSGISVDNQDHIWILHRPATVMDVNSSRRRRSISLIRHNKINSLRRLIESIGQWREMLP
jgi:hypothetical protein